MDLSSARDKLQEANERNPPATPASINTAPSKAAPPRGPPKPAVPLSSIPDAIQTGFLAKCNQDGLFTVRPCTFFAAAACGSVIS